MPAGILSAQLEPCKGTGADPDPPFIKGPVALGRLGPPPSFEVDPHPNAFYAIEVATRPELFIKADHGAERDESNFHASWAQSPALLANRTYTLPQSVWDRLKTADRLYYRIWTSSEASVWENAATTIMDGEARNAAFVRVTAGGESLPHEGNLFLVLTVQEGPPSAGATSEPVVKQVNYREAVTEKSYETVTILPHGDTVSIDRVY